MRKKAENPEVDLSLGSGSLSRSIEIYIAVCIVGLVVIIALFNHLIERHDKQLTGQVCSLVTEKVSNSIEYMTKSVSDISAILAYTDSDRVDRVYQQLRQSMDEAEYLSIGIIMDDGKIYASDSERDDLKKWGLIEKATITQGVEISQPYRSALTGQLVFTIFSRIGKRCDSVGTLFVTYPLEEILNLTQSEALDRNTEVWLMDRYSDNIINCTGTDDFLIGSWNNIKLNKEITGNEKFENWAKLMHSGEASASVTYNVNGETYMQVYEQLDLMDGWNIVVRTPTNELSSAMRIFRMAVIIFAAVVVSATALMLISARRRNDSEKKILENLSIYDPLSQVMNRRAFNFAASAYMEKCSKEGGALLFFDIDLFKNINDKYGHEAGDAVIVSVAAELKATFGDCGIVSRYGGDEFVVLIKNRTVDEINDLMAQLRDRVRAIKVESEKAPTDELEVHFSAGLAAFDGREVGFKELIGRADAALYRVKENGRDGFRWADA